MAHWPSFDGYDPGISDAAPRGKSRGAEQGLATPVPAVERAIAILRFLETSLDEEACTVSGISRALGINKSTCSNILRTLAAGGFVEYDAGARAYGLGAGLIGLGIKARNRPFPAVCMPHLQRLVRKTGFTCVAFEQLPDGHFAIVAKVDSPRDVKVTIDVGQQFPPGAPVFARIALAWSDPAAVESFIELGMLKRYTSLSRVDPDALRAELVQTRQRGYTPSVGEYYLANTAIAAPVFSAQRDMCRGICMVGFNSEIPDDELPRYGEAVRDGARAVTRAMAEAS